VRLWSTESPPLFENIPLRQIVVPIPACVCRCRWTIRRRPPQETATMASTPPSSPFRATLPCTTCTSIRDSLPSTWYRCRLDKASTRWKNVLAPPRHSQLNAIGTCFEITDKYRLCIDMRSLNLPTIAPPLPAAPLNLTTSHISAESSPLMVPLLLSDLAR
jgi:hypothetical protein